MIVGEILKRLLRYPTNQKVFLDIEGGLAQIGRIQQDTENFEPPIILISPFNPEAERKIAQLAREREERIKEAAKRLPK